MGTTAQHGLARWAGLAYFIVIVTGVFALAYAPGVLFAGADDGAAIRQSVVTHLPLYRGAIVAEAACYAAFLILPLLLYRLLREAGEISATIMAGLAIASVPLGFANMAHQFDILRIAEGAPLTSTLSDDARATQLALARQGYRDGMLMLQVFWGGWLIPFGLLVFRCGFLPRWIGVLLVLAGLGYVGDFVGRMLFDGYASSALPRVLRAPRMGEMLICAWLILFGARRGIPLPSFIGKRRAA